MLGSSIQPAWERGSADSRPAGLSHRRHQDRIPLPPILAGIPAGPAGSEQKTPFLNDKFSVTAQTSPVALPAAFLPGKAKDTDGKNTLWIMQPARSPRGHRRYKNMLFVFFGIYSHGLHGARSSQGMSSLAGLGCSWEWPEAAEPGAAGQGPAVT